VAVRGTERAAPSQRVLQSIASASQKTGVSFRYLLNQARTESSFDPSAKARTSTAKGLFQFTDQTWLATLHNHGAQHGLEWAANAIQKGPSGNYFVADAQLKQQVLDLRFDAEASSAMAGEFASENSDFLSQKLGRPTDETDLSVAHFLGAGGALKFLTAFGQSPEASAAPYFPEAAAANPSIFYGSGGVPRSFAQIHARFAQKAGAQAPNAIFAPAAVQSTRQEATTSSSASGEMPRWTERMAAIEPMPDRLSLSFAQATYRKLASLGGGQ